MDHPPLLPDGLHHVRTTPWFEAESVPPGLLRNHQVANGVWGRLIIAEGSIEFRFEDEPEAVSLTAGDSIGIPPGRLHRVILAGTSRFAVEFHKAPEQVEVPAGSESTGLTDQVDTPG